jgi:putative spermidine/putrescine transport system permease protein
VRTREAAVRALPAALVTAVPVALALWAVLRTSVGLRAGEGWGSADPGVYADLAADPAVRESLVLTLAVAAAATVLSVLVALPLAAAVRRRGTAARLTALSAVPVPHLLVAVVVVAWLGPGGLVDRLAGSIPLDPVRDAWGAGVVLVYVLKEAPFIALLVLAAWGPEVAARQEAAAGLGAGPVARARLVVWPAVRRAVLTGAALAALFVVGSFEVPLVIGPTDTPLLTELALTSGRSAELDGRATEAALLGGTTVLALLLGAVAGWSLYRPGRRG